MAKSLRRRLVVVYLFALGLVAVFAGAMATVDLLEVKYRLADENVKLIHKLDNLRLRVEHELYEPLALAKSLQAFISVRGGITQEEFEKLSEIIMSDNSAGKRISLAKGTIISMVYPRKGNESALGKDYKDIPDQWPSVERAIREHVPVFNGPVNLIQGGAAFIVRIPIYLSNHKNSNVNYFGLVSAALDSDKFISRIGIDQINIPISIRGGDGNMVIGSFSDFNKSSVRLDVQLPYGNWEIGAIPLEGFSVIHGQVMFVFILTIVAQVLFVMAVATVIWHIRRLYIARTQLKEKNAEACLALSLFDEQLSFLNSIVDAIPGGFYYKNADGIYIGCNSEFADFVGLSKADIVGRTVFDHTFPDDAEGHAESDRRLMASGGTIAYETKVFNNNGGYSDVIISKACYCPNGYASRGIVGVVIDISERKQYERTVAEARVNAELANIAKSRLLSTISHELRTPLNAIIGFSDILRSHSNEVFDAATVSDYARAISESGHRLFDTLTDVIDIASVEIGGKLPDIDCIPMSSKFIRNIISLISSAAATRCVAITNNIQIDGHIYADPKMLKQILFCICDNAIKFNKDGGSVVVSSEESPSGTFIRCIDTGVGIPSDSLGRIREPFFRVESSRGKYAEGMGLGLTIVEKLINMHGGMLEIESSYGVGTSVIMFFPAR